MANSYRLKTTGPEDPKRIEVYEKSLYLRVGMTINNTTFKSAPMTPRQFEAKLAGFGGLGFDFIEAIPLDDPTRSAWDLVWI